MSALPCVKSRKSLSTNHLAQVFLFKGARKRITQWRKKSVNTKRKVASKKQRLTPCECCGWPLSERHHLLDVAQYGENESTVQLCANCHDLYHLMYRKYVTGTDSTILGNVLLRLGTGNKTTQKIYNLVIRSRQLAETFNLLVFKESEK